MSIFTIKIGKLWSSPEGTTEKGTVKAVPNFTVDGINFNSPLAANFLLIKLKNEISVILSDIEITVEAQCQRCLSFYQQPMTIPTAERQFFAEKPERPQDFDELFFIDFHHMAVDLSEMLRQEIILHFPMIPVCLESCKGLCQLCGRKLESEVCKNDHQSAEEPFQQPEQQPFKNLKQLIYGKKANS